MESMKNAALKGGAPPDTDRRGALQKESTYKVDGRKFIVKPVFQQDGGEPITSILMRLMKADVSQP